MADPFFSNVVLLCHFDGANGSQTITDSSSKHSVTTTSALTTTSPKFGTASLATGGSTITTSNDSADWAFGSGQFTVECFIRPTSAISGIRGLITQFGPSGNLGWFFGFNATALALFYSTTGSDNPAVSGTYSPTLNAWIHVAADRDASNVLRVYADGVVIASATVSATFFDSTRTLIIGNDENVSRGFAGQIDELRITKGIARYGGPFTPPTAPFEDAASAQQYAVTVN